MRLCHRSGTRCLPAVIAAAALMFATGGAWAAKTVYVDGVNGNDAWDGLCEEWDGGTCGPKKTIQAGINVASNGDDVSVADAAYTGVNNRYIQFLGKAITVHSKNGPANCIVDIAGGTDPAFHFQSSETTASVLDGFTVINCSGC
jgi:hypothetical protein